MKIKSNRNYGHHFRVFRKLRVIPAGLVVEFTNAEYEALKENPVFNNAVSEGALEVTENQQQEPKENTAGKKKTKPKKGKTEDGLDSHTDQ